MEKFQVFSFPKALSLAIHICDWANENGPSGHTKFDHIFQLCCTITIALAAKAIEVTFLSPIHNLIDNILQLTESKYSTQNSRYVPFYDMVYFVSTWSLFAVPVTYTSAVGVTVHESSH